MQRDSGFVNVVVDELGSLECYTSNGEKIGGIGKISLSECWSSGIREVTVTYPANLFKSEEEMNKFLGKSVTNGTG